MSQHASHNHTRTKFRPAIKVHGGKFYLARRHLSLLPSAGSYLVDGFAGGWNLGGNAAIRLTRHAVLNDADWRKANLYTVVRDHTDELARRLRDMVYAERTFERSKAAMGQWRWSPPQTEADRIQAAADFLACNRMSRGGLGKAFAWSERLRGGRPGDLNAWLTMIDSLADTARRLRGVRIFNWTAEAMLACYGDDPGAILYLDPPYVPDERVSRLTYEEYELSTQRHEQLLDRAMACRARVMLCGYRSDLYDTMLSTWRRVEWDMPNNSSQQKEKQRRTECVWVNYPASSPAKVAA